MRFLTVLGARPQFIKAGPLSAELRRSHQEYIVHTGQHYDHGMSEVFFQELGLPEPDCHLGVGSGSHGAQTAAMLSALEAVMLRENPDVVLVYGDTNSTLAGALAAVKLHVRVAHVEAGLRSFNRAMPEEINRLVTDHVSSWLFAPSPSACAQLAREGITSGVHDVGDIMLDVIRSNAERANTRSSYPGVLGLDSGSYYVATLHRPENTDNAQRLAALLAGLDELDCPVVFPVHPRTRRRMEEFGLRAGANIRLLEPLGYLDMLALQRNAACILTDSGGVQKEAYYLSVPCVTLRGETEWTETVTAGWNVLAAPDPDAMQRSVRQVRAHNGSHPDLYGSGDTAQRIARVFDTN